MTSPDGRALPDGTVTFLFLDIERSTELLEEIGADYPRLLEIYRSLTESAVSGRGGVVFGSEGDGLFAAFPEARAAAEAAVESQRSFAETAWPGNVEVRVRMGVHTGSPTLIGDDYTGIDVHRAARIMSAAWGGQVLLSETTQSLFVDAELTTRELGWYRMKGLSRYERLYQLGAPGLPGDFPALRARRREVELPAHLTSLIGREGDVEAVVGILRSGTRLVTLSGPGGVGKTRIALEVAERMDTEYTDGVVFADVSNETEKQRMMVVVAESVGAAYDQRRSRFDTLADHLSSLHMLLVLDGFDRFSEEAVEVAELLARCPRLQLLVTSRVVLRIGAEREHRVGPLPVPPEGASLEAIAASPATRLFVERAAAVHPGLALTAENAGTIRNLVATLDGIPLSIELAAARARLMTPQAILDRLESVLDLGTTASELPARQRSLRSTIEWSHSLLKAEEQALLRRLGVFVDGWSIEAAEAVGGEEAVDVILGLENLVAQSLVRVEADTRMSMGTAMREFAREQLAAVGEEEAICLRHARYFTDFAETTEPLMRGPRQREVLNTLSRDWHNFRGAGEWALQSNHLDLAGRLYTNIWILSWLGDNWDESEAFTRRFAPLMDRLEEPIRARALFIAAGTYMEMGQGERAIGFARPALELSERIGDRVTEAWSRMILAGSTVLLDVLEPEARDQIEMAVEGARRIDDPFLLAYALSFQGAVATLDGDIDGGIAAHQECLELARSLGNQVLTALALSQMAMSHLASGELGKARSALEGGLEAVDQIRSVETLAVYLDAVAWLAFAESDPVRAMTVLGAANASRAKVGAARWGLLTGLLEAAGVAAESDQPALAAARRAGGEMTPHDAITFGIHSHRELAVAI
ncbi:MAG: AAA family ATPase [Acidimicrobiia bacterium]